MYLYFTLCHTFVFFACFWQYSKVLLNLHLCIAIKEIRKNVLYDFLNLAKTDSKYINVHICLHIIKNKLFAFTFLFACLLYLQGHFQWSAISSLVENELWNFWSSSFITHPLTRHQINWQTVIQTSKSFCNYSVSSEIFTCYFLIP